MSFQPHESDIHAVWSGCWRGQRDGSPFPVHAAAAPGPTCWCLLRARLIPAPDAVVAAAPGQRRWQRIPLFLHLRAVKPQPAMS